MNINNYAVFILTFSRANNVITYKTLRKQGYTGKIFLICSDDDPQLPVYLEKYKNEVIVFSKNVYKNKFDIADNFSNEKVVVYARNANFDIAEKLGYKYFIQLDDDYTGFFYRFSSDLFYQTKLIKNLDKIFEICFEYYISMKNCKALAIAQGGDFIGGGEGSLGSKIKIKRKIMNVYFLSTERRFNFIGRINEDTNSYVYYGTLGNLMFQINHISITQKETQTNLGGLTDFYKELGTYVKSFYTILFAPSCTKIKLMGNYDYRLHHNIQWNNCTPLILEEKYKKK